MDCRIDRDEIIQSMDEMEFRAEAKRRGYRLVMIPEKVERSIRLLPCTCGETKIDAWYHLSRYVFYRCSRCGEFSEHSKSKQQAKLNWNKMIKGKMKNATD